MTVECNNTDAEAAQDTTTYRVEADESPSMAVVEAVAAVSGRTPVTEAGATDALGPLFRSIDPESLDRIFESRGDDPEDAAFVEFDYCDHHVTVKGGKTVCVTVE